MSLVTQIAALATRVAAEIKLLRTEIPPGLPAYAGTAQEVLTQTPGGSAWSRDLSINALTVSGMTVGLGGGASETNMAMGLNALAVNTTGFGLAAVGSDALASNTSGNYNFAGGFSALAALTTGSDNTVLGTLAGSRLETGGSNTFAGRGAGSNVKTGSSNTIIGRYNGTVSLAGTIVLAAGTTIRAWCDNTGKWGFGTTAPTASLDTEGDSLRIRTASTPASATAPGEAGTIKWDADYLYVCVATDTWKCLPLAAFGATAGGGGGGLGIPVYVQQTQPEAPAIWYQTDADGVVIDILRVT